MRTLLAVVVALVLGAALGFALLLRHVLGDR